MAEHRQGDTRFYDRVLSEEEISSIYRAGRHDDRKKPNSPGDYVARWHPDRVTQYKLGDLSSGGYDLTFARYDESVFVIDEPIDSNGFNKLYAVGNSLTADASPSILTLQSDALINPSQSMIFHAAMPGKSTYGNILCLGNGAGDR